MSGTNIDEAGREFNGATPSGGRNAHERKPAEGRALGQGGEVDTGPLGRHYYAAGAGVRLFTRELGQGPAVVVLHGGPGAGHDYLLPSLRTLADEFRLLFYDQRGGGRSRVERPSRISWRDHVADLDQLREDWGLESMTLLGYSWGGLLALLYATLQSHKLSSLVLIAPAAGWGDYHQRFRKEFERRSRAPEVMKMRSELEASELEQRDPAAYRQRRFDLSVAGYFRDPQDAYDSTPFLVQAQAQQSTWTSLRHDRPELEPQLRELRVPTLILHGRYDPIPLDWAVELAELMPAARLVVLENSGHVPHIEERERTLSQIRGFLREQLAP